MASVCPVLSWTAATFDRDHERKPQRTGVCGRGQAHLSLVTLLVISVLCVLEIGCGGGGEATREMVLACPLDGLSGLSSLIARAFHATTRRHRWAGWWRQSGEAGVGRQWPRVDLMNLVLCALCSLANGILVTHNTHAHAARRHVALAAATGHRLATLHTAQAQSAECARYMGLMSMSQPMPARCQWPVASMIYKTDGGRTPRALFAKTKTECEHTDFLSIFLSRFWAFLGEGGSKTL
jgi:hypothetical protein